MLYISNKINSVENILGDNVDENHAPLLLQDLIEKSWLTKDYCYYIFILVTEVNDSQDDIFLLSLDNLDTPLSSEKKYL